MTDSITALRLDGAILTPPLCDDPDVLAVLEAADLPYVRISPHADLTRSGMVCMDDRAAATDMTEHLIGLGHRDIGFIKGDPAHNASRERYEGFLAAMTAAGLVVDQVHVVEGDFSFRAGLDLGDQLLQAEPPPSAIFASNDDMALGVLMTAMKRRLDVPGRLSIAGFDDAPTARAAWPQLTTIRQPKAEMAAAAVDILVERQFRLNQSSDALHRSLAYGLVIRGSTGLATAERP